MDPFRARSIVEMLSRGIDPATGLALRHNDSCAAEDVRAALLEVLSHCTIQSAEQYILETESDAHAAREKRAAQNALRYPRGGTPWSAREEQELLSLLRRGKNIYQIAAALKRTPRAISERMRNLQYAAPPSEKKP